jgi:hypothetical protein
MSTSDIDPDDRTILKRPFTADQIREEMVVGLRVLIRRVAPTGETVERWTVIAADEDGVEIEYAQLDSNNSVSGETGSNRSAWVELRDHATFPADRASRERVTRDTALGTYDGWLYRVDSEDGNSTNLFFFADTIPGAPLEMRILQGENEVFTMEQFARLRPQVE